MNKDISKIEEFDPCKDGLAWFQAQPDFATAWQTCERGDWMLWYAQNVGVDIRPLTLAKARCAKLVLHLMKDERSRNAVEVAERFGRGEATREELDAAANAAAYAAYAAAKAAAYAAAKAAAKAAAYAADATATFAATFAAAFYAAYAAYCAATFATADAARIEILSKCADICRVVLTKYVL